MIRIKDKKTLYLLIDHYLNNKIYAWNFVRELRAVYVEQLDLDMLTNKQRKIFSDLSMIGNAFLEDLRLYPGHYFVKEEFRLKVFQAAELLKEEIDCCSRMSYSLTDLKVPIGYLPKFREYFLNLRFTKSVDTFDYCPWCGRKLPRSLRDNYFEILEKEYGIDDDIQATQTRQLPEEFKSDEWWKKRNL